MRNIYCRVFFLLVLFIKGIAPSGAQISANGNLPKIIPPSPNAASLGIYGEIPVSKYTGVPSIEVPLYTLSVGSLSLPISLNYHASGIKVAQEASWVGLGWSLNAGGVISRTIKGMDDFGLMGSTIAGYTTNSNFPACTGEASVPTPSNWQEWQEILEGRKDSEPDEFYYNLGSSSGKMVYAPSTRKFMPLKADNLKIDGGMGKWVFTTIEGVRYVFTTPERTTSHNRNESVTLPQEAREDITNYPGTPSTTSWYLDSIVSPTKEYIIFKYDTTPHATPSVVYESQSYRWLYGLVAPLCPPEQTGGGNVTGYIYSKAFTQEYPSFGYSQSVVNDVYLKEIQGSNGLKVTFTTEGRLDLKAPARNSTATPAQKLVKITISSSGTTKTLEHIFDYSYFPTAEQNYKHLRLRLDKVTTRANGITNPPYQFTYNNSTLPAKNSKDIDHWGFYNGSGNNSIASNWSNVSDRGTLIPSYTFRRYNNDNTYEEKQMVGAIREPNETLVQYAMLTGIKYPTGGTTAFTYEINRYYDGFNTSTITRTVVEDEARSAYNGVPIEKRTPFVAPFTGRYIISTYSYPIPPIPTTTNEYIPYCESVPAPSGPMIKKYRFPNAGSVLPIFCDIGYPGNTFAKLAWFRYNDWDLSCGSPDTRFITKTVDLVAGQTYQLNLAPARGFLVKGKVTIDEKVDTPINARAGGVRIKQIVANDGRQTLTKSYDYTMPSGRISGTDSGVLLAPIAYHYVATPTYSNDRVNNQPLVWLRYAMNDQNLRTNQMLFASSSSCLPLGTSGSGSSVGYSRVTEITGTQNAPGGKVIETFINDAERTITPGSNSFFPGLPNLPRNANGLVKRTLTFGADGTLVKAVGNTYEASANQTTSSRGVIVYGGLPAGGCTVPTYVRCYERMTEWWRKTSDTTTVYPINSANSSSLRTVNNYTYDPVNLLINKQTTRTSGGDLLTTSTAFAHNAPSETQTPATTLAALAARNMIGIPIKQETFQNTKRIQAKVTNFNSKLLPASIQILEGSQLPVRVNYDYYDEGGNLAEYHITNDVHSAVLWGYQKTRPILQAKNTTYSTLKNVVDQVLQEMGYTNGVDAFLTALADLSTLQQQAQLQTFITKVRGNSSLNRTQITIHTYHPLFGKLSETDLAGRTSYFEYDALGRLLRIKDEQGRILSQQEYYYAQ